jgi:HEPN domain-containing protein
MLNRWKRLIREAERQLLRAEAARKASRPVWAWFAAHESAEYAVKALRLRHSLNGHERMVTRLLLDLPASIRVPEALLEKAQVFDSHYMPIRLEGREPLDQPRVNGIATDHAVDTAREILAFVHAELQTRRPPDARSA